MKKGKMWKAGAAGMMAAGTGAVLMMASRKKERMYRLTDSNSSCKNKGSKGPR